jgi:hypothetical protein
MKRSSFLASAALCLTLLTLTIAAPAQILNNGSLTQSGIYGNWQANSQNAVSSGTGTITMNQCYFRTNPLGINGPTPASAMGMNSQFFPLSTTMKVTVVDGSNTETVTPTAVSAPTIAPPSGVTPYTCSFTASFSNSHGVGVTLISGDAGLGEAALDNSRGYGITAGATTYAGVCTGTATASSTIYLYGLGGAGSAETCTLTAVSGNPPVLNRPAALKNLLVTAGTGGVSSSSGVFKILDNGTATGITCTIGTGTTCQDTTHAYLANAGDVITADFTTQASETLAGVVVTVESF